MAHTSPYLFCQPSSCTYTSHITKNDSFLLTLCIFSILVKFIKFQTVSHGFPPSQPHTFSAGLLFDKTFAQPDVAAVVNCPVVALSVFHSTVIIMGGGTFFKVGSQVHVKINPKPKPKSETYTQNLNPGAELGGCQGGHCPPKIFRVTSCHCIEII